MFGKNKRYRSTLAHTKEDDEDPDQDLNLDDLSEEEAKEKLKKYKDKDYNFDKVRKAKEDYKEKYERLKNGEDDDENDDIEKGKENIKEQVQTELQKEKSKEMEKVRDKLIDQMASDEDEKEKIKFHYNRLADNPTSVEEVQSALKDANTLASSGNKSGSNAVLNAVPFTPSTNVGKTTEKQDEKRFSETEEGKELANRLGLQYPNLDNNN